MTDSKPILLRRASAGSGKTYILARTYIRLLLEGYFNPDASDGVRQYRHILAVTFTNKATAEMKERILRELDILAKSPAKSSFFKDFSTLFGRSEAELKKAAGEILFHLLHDYGSFSVSTIDSFFQLVLRAFSREVGYYSSYQVELDRKGLVTESVERILDSLDEGEDNKELLDWLSRQALYRVSNGEKFSTDVLLQNVAERLMTDNYKEALLQSQMDEEKLYDHKRLQALEESCRKMKKACKEKIRDAAREAEQERQRALGDIVTSGSTLEKVLGKLTAMGTGEKDAIPSITDAAYAKLFLPAGAVDACQWFKKADRRYFEDGAGLELLLQKMDALRAAYEEALPLVRTLDVISSQLYGFGVVRRIRQELDALMKEKNVLSLDETNEILKDLISDTDTPFIYEKVGVRFEHFLLDEFQDTSHVQWNNFRPLLKESVDNGHSNLIVGDPKQSIYRWRNSDATLMTEVLPKTFDSFIDDAHELDTNWRSAKEIIRFNNAFFSYAAAQMDKELQQGTPLQDIYKDVRQKENKRGGGYVRLDFCVARETEEGKVKAFDVEMEKVLESIGEALAHGYRPGDITVVVRTGAQGIQLGSFLTEHYIKVSTSDTLGIASSSIVRLLLSLLSSRDDPNDNMRAWLAEKFLSEQGTLPDECSLADLCEGMLREIKKRHPDEFRRQIAYIRCFMDVLNDYVARGDNSLHAFVRYMDGRNDSISSPEAPDAVNIITIHKVKGLDAPYVIAPFIESIEWARVDGKGESIWCVPDLKGSPLQGMAEGVYQVCLTAKTAGGSHFEQSYLDERRLEYIDNLNVLYVAFTRPVEVLHIISASPKDTETASFPALLRQYAEDHMTEEENGAYAVGVFALHPAGEKENAEGNERCSVRELRPADAWPSFPRGSRVQLRADASDFFQSEGQKAVSSSRINGTVMHDILSQVVHPEDLDAAVHASVLSGALEADKEQETLAFLRLRIDAAVQRGWFPSGDSGWHIRNEATILMPQGHDYRTDRVLDNGEEVVIIDYKTGARHSSYARQMQDYARAYRSMGRRKVTTHLWYLASDEVETQNFA